MTCVAAEGSARIRESWRVEGAIGARAANAEHEVVVQLPDDGGLSVGGEIVVRLLEVSATDESPERRER